MKNNLERKYFIINFFFEKIFFLDIMTLLKSNNSSNDNTLAFPYFNPKNDTYSVPPPPPKVQSTIIPEFNRIMNPSFASGSVPNFNSNGNHMNSYEPRSNSNNLTNFSEQAISGKHNSANNDLRNSIDFFTKQSYKQVNFFVVVYMGSETLGKTLEENRIRLHSF